MSVERTHEVMIRYLEGQDESRHPRSKEGFSTKKSLSPIVYLVMRNSKKWIIVDVVTHVSQTHAIQTMA